MPPIKLSPLLAPALALPLLALGCAVEPDVETTVAFLGEGGGSCTGNCGKNGPVVDGSATGHLHRNGVANDYGTSLVEFYKWGHPDMGISVANNRLLGFNKVTGFTEILGPTQLVGAMFIVQQPDPSGIGIDYYAVRIKEVNESWWYWTAPALPIEHYKLTYDGPYDDPDAPKHMHPPTGLPLCPQIDEPWLGEHTMDAAVFEGEIFHQPDLRIEDTAPGTNGWFTIACAGSATLKQLLTRRVRRPVPLDTGEPLRRPRKTMLQAMTADYCNKGETFTVSGVPLLVRDADGTIPHDHDASWQDGDDVTYEAIWNGAGAVCVENWRRMQYDAENPEVHDPSSIDDARALCAAPRVHPLPTCTSLLGPKFASSAAGWETLGTVLTAFPTENLTPPP